LARTTLARRARIAAVAKKYAGIKNALYLGRKWMCPIALEGALKLKEISYIHAEGYGAGEMKHGPIALIDQDLLSVVLAPEDSLAPKTRANIEEIRARGGPVLAVTTEGYESELAGITDDLLTIPPVREELIPILATSPLQLFAYYVARERGCPIDQPRNLAKSVTVE
jgi:glucosamine--fructose-6-phosphate aminotransferase (isomerizing)